jgi:hypothetical protein
MMFMKKLVTRRRDSWARTATHPPPKLIRRRTFMDSTAIPWIMLASVGVASCSAIAAAISAWFSWRSSQTATNAAATAANAAATAADAAATNLILKFRDRYASDEMMIDLRNLRAWHDKHGSKFAETWRDKLKQKDEEAHARPQRRT